MEMTAERCDGILIIEVGGRLDGYAAEEVKRGIATSLRDDDRSVVIDLAGLAYLSSAGIRVFLGLQKELKVRGGGLAICNVGEYPLQVLAMAGFDRVFTLFPSRAAALAASFRREDSLSLIADLAAPPVEYEGAKFRFEPGSWTPASLRVKGSIDDLLHARIREEGVSAETFSDIRYSLGLGALGSSLLDAMPFLGEMVTLQGSMTWLPSDGHNTPDFFVPARVGGEVRAYTAFNVALDGQFNEFATVEAEEGITLEALYRAVFAHARERKVGAGVVAVALWGVTGGVLGSGIRKAPLARDAPARGGSIFDPENVGDWIEASEEPKYAGDSIVAFGIGLDPSADLSSCDAGAIASLSGHPRGEGDNGLILHTHGVVFRKVPWDLQTPLEKGIDRCLAEGEFVDMRHLLDGTRILRAHLGIAYISSITRG
ncbi:STAS domain-containing protein [Methanofollis ethanolicus]|uniref:STAS domain-containing protein n=1 Tax=Methanofollis ethanolicus TaxID=488124 RepID=UPI000836F31A|nr:STAS domain-containing protein [Methanofollis ethanolicus]